jgi:hypothetical protein
MVGFQIVDFRLQKQKQPTQLLEFALFGVWSRSSSLVDPAVRFQIAPKRALTSEICNLKFFTA